MESLYLAASVVIPMGIYMLIGGAIAADLCDSEGIALVAGLSAVVVPLFNLLAVIIFELSREGKIAFSKII